MVNTWSHSTISQAAHLTLINSSLFSIPTYFLCLFLIPNSIMDSISKLACKFLWGWNGEGKSFHTVGWNTVITSKSEEGLGLKNLRLANTALLSKHLFSILNQNKKNWITLFHRNYPKCSLWNIKAYSKTSWFYKFISTIVDLLKNNFNPRQTNFLNDPWILTFLFLVNPPISMSTLWRTSLGLILSLMVLSILIW